MKNCRTAINQSDCCILIQSMINVIICAINVKINRASFALFSAAKYSIKHAVAHRHNNLRKCKDKPTNLFANISRCDVFFKCVFVLSAKPLKNTFVTIRSECYVQIALQ